MPDDDVLDISDEDLPEVDTADEDVMNIPEESLPEVAEEGPSRWYVYAEGAVHGPYPQADLYHWVQNGSISWDTMVSRGRADSWRAIRDVEEFYDPKHPYGGTPPPPPNWVGPRPGSQGTAQPRMIPPSSPPKSPALGCVLNILIIGVGYIYLGQVTKGVTAFLVAYVVGGIFITMTFGLGVIPWLIVPVLAAIDAYKIGQKLERGEPVGEWEFLPS